MQTCSSSFSHVRSTVTVKLIIMKSLDQFPILLELWPLQCYINQHSFLKETRQGKIKCWRNETYYYLKCTVWPCFTETKEQLYLAYMCVHSYLYLLNVSLNFTIPIVMFNWAVVTELFVDVMFTKNINYITWHNVYGLILKLFNAHRIWRIVGADYIHLEHWEVTINRIIL